MGKKVKKNTLYTRREGTLAFDACVIYPVWEERSRRAYL